MQFAANAHLDSLLKAARRLGSNLKTVGTENLQEIVSTIEDHEYFNIVGVEGQISCEAVTVAKDGEFLCVMVKSTDRQPVSFVRENLNNFLDKSSDLSVICNTLETIRQSFVAHASRSKALGAA